MASFTQRRLTGSAWTIEQCAEFAAVKEFKLLQLLSTDPAALRTARKLTCVSSVRAQGSAQKTSKHKANGRTKSAAVPEAPEKAAGRRQNRGQRERKLRSAAATKLQALAVGFLTRRKELPAAREIALRRTRAEASSHLAAIREDVLAAQEAAMHPPPLVRESKRRVAFVAEGGTHKRCSSPSVSSASSFTSACEESEMQTLGDAHSEEASPTHPASANPFLRPWTPGGRPPGL